MAWLPLPPSLSNGQVVKYKIEYGLGKEGEWGQGVGHTWLGVSHAEGWSAQLGPSRAGVSLRKLGSVVE